MKTMATNDEPRSQNYAKHVEAKLAACQKAGRAALVAARAQIMDLQKQLAETVSPGLEGTVALAKLPTFDEPQTQDLQRTIEHLKLDLELQVDKRHHVDEERMRMENDIEWYKERIQELVDQLDFANQRIEHFKLDQSTECVQPTPVALAESRLRGKVEKRNIKLTQKLYKASTLLSSQQAQMRRYDREIHEATNRELAMQKQVQELKEKADLYNSDSFRIKESTKNKSESRVLSQTPSLPAKFSSYSQEPPRH